MRIGPVFLFAIFLTAGLQAQLTNEIAVGAVSYGPAAGDQVAPVVGSNGDGFFAAWLDARSWDPAVCATRISGNGTVLDGTGIRIPLLSGAANIRMLGAFWTGAAYTVAWSYQLFPSDPSTTGYYTAIARISADGQVIDGPRVVLDRTFTYAAASNGSRIVLVGGDVIAVLNENGFLIERDIPVGTAPAYGVSAASNGQTFLLATYTYDQLVNRINFIALDSGGHPTTTTRLLASGGGDGPVMASNGDDYLVFYRDAQGAAAQQVSPAATTLASSRTGIADARAIAWNGSAYAVVSATGVEQTITVSLYDPKGAVIRGAGAIGAGTWGVTDQPAVASDGRHTFVAWATGSQQLTNAIDMSGLLLGSDGSSASGVLSLSMSANPQRQPHLATGGRNDLLVWNEMTGTYAARITRSRQVLDSTPILLFQDSIVSRDFLGSAVPQLRVTWDGSAYVVARLTSAVEIQRVDGDTGQLIGTSMIAAPCAKSIDLQRDDTGVVLFAGDCKFALFAQRIGAHGPVGGSVTISPPDMLADSPAAAWNGSEWLVAWSRLTPLPIVVEPPGTAYRRDVFAERLSLAMTPIDAAPIAVDASQSDDTSSPVVATSGRDFLVAWSHSWTDVATGVVAGIYVHRIRADGTFNETGTQGMLVVPGTGLGVYAAAWDGSHYAIPFRIDRGGWSEVDLAYVSASGPAVGAVVAISPSGVTAQDADLIAAAGDVRLTYARTAAETVYGGVPRVFVRDFVQPVRQRAVHH